MEHEQLTPLAEPPLADNTDNRERILSAAVRAFGEHGYEGASTNQICAAAGISKGLLFHYYKSKENLFIAVLEHCMTRFLEAVRTGGGLAGQPLTPETLAGLYRRQTRFLSEHPDYYRIFTQPPQQESQLLTDFFNRKREEYQQTISLGLRLFLSRSNLRPGISREAALELMTGLVIHLQEKYLTDLSRQTLPVSQVTEMMEAEFVEAMDIIFHGILLEKP